MSRNINYDRYDIARMQYELDKKRGNLQKMSVYRDMVPLHSTSELIDRFLVGELSADELLAEHETRKALKKTVKSNEDNTLFNVEEHNKVYQLIEDIDKAFHTIPDECIEKEVLRIIGNYLLK